MDEILLSRALVIREELLEKREELLDKLASVKYRIRQLQFLWSKLDA